MTIKNLDSANSDDANSEKKEAEIAQVSAEKEQKTEELTNDKQEDASNGLKKALEAERAARKALEKQIKENSYNSAKKEGDIAALEKSWEEKLAQKLAEKEQEVEQALKKTQELEAAISQTIVQKTASEIALTVASTPENAQLILPHILKDFSSEIQDGQVRIRVLQDGKPSALTVDEYRENLAKNPLFSGVIKKTNIVGSGAKAIMQNAVLPKTQTKLTEAQREAMLAQRIQDRIGR